MEIKIMRLVIILILRDLVLNGQKNERGRAGGTLFARSNGGVQEVRAYTS